MTERVELPPGIHRAVDRARVANMEPLRVLEKCLECGSKCCRTPTMVIQVWTGEMRRMKAEAERLGIDPPRFTNLGRRGRQEGDDVVPDDLWRMHPTEDGTCAFLDEAGLCRAHEERPRSCRAFPHRPFRGCLLWPGEGDDPAVEPLPTSAV